MTTEGIEAATPFATPEVTRPSETSIFCLASWLLLLSCFIYVRPILLPIDEHFIDDHWAAFLNVAFLAHKQFGTEVVFTYGPWGFLVHPRNVEGIYPWVVLGRAILSVGCCLGLACLSERWIERRSLRALWASSILILAEPIYLLTPLLCLLLWREPPARNVKDRLLLHSIAVSAGLAANTKFTCFVLLVLLVPPLLLRRHSRLISVTAILSWLVFWLMAGQGLANLPAFILNSFEMSSTYGAAQAWMSTPLGRVGGLLICGFPVALCLIAELRHPSFGSFAFVCWIGLYEYIVLGQAIIRCDSGHIALGLIGAALPLALALLACPHLWRSELGLIRPVFVLATLISMGLTYLCIGSTLWKLQPTYRPLFVEAIQRLNEVVHPGRDNRISPTPIERASFTTDGAAGVGVLPFRAGYAFANHLHLNNIPTVQSVMAWSPRLTAIDAAFLESTKAPGTIYFEIVPFDRHYPSLEDPLAWRSLLTHYQPSGNRDGFLVLLRRSRPAHAVRKLVVERSIQVGESIEVPEIAGNIVWAEIEAHRAWRGKLQILCLNSQHLLLDIDTPQGPQTSFFQSANAVSGFILSPYIDSEDAMKSLYVPGGPVNLPQRVSRFTLRATLSAKESFASPIQVRLYSLSIQ